MRSVFAFTVFMMTFSRLRKLSIRALIALGLACAQLGCSSVCRLESPVMEDGQLAEQMLQGPAQCGTALALLPWTAARQYQRFSYEPPAGAGAAERYLAERARRNAGWMPCPADRCASARACDSANPRACAELADLLWAESRLDLTEFVRIRDDDWREVIRLRIAACDGGYTPSCDTLDEFRTNNHYSWLTADPGRASQLYGWACETRGDAEICARAARSAQQVKEWAVHERTAARACRLGNDEGCRLLREHAGAALSGDSSSQLPPRRVDYLASLADGTGLESACTNACDRECAQDIARCRETGDRSACFEAAACSCRCSAELGGCGFAEIELTQCVDESRATANALGSDM